MVLVLDSKIIFVEMKSIEVLVLKTVILLRPVLDLEDLRSTLMVLLMVITFLEPKDIKVLISAKHMV